MLGITSKAEQKLREIAEEQVAKNDIGDATSGVRITVSRPDDGSSGNKCKIGPDEQRTGDQIIEVGDMNLIFDPSTFAFIGGINAILDFSQEGSEQHFILIVEPS